MKTKFLPTNLTEGKQYYKDFKQFDVIFITGDPYYDHPLSGIAILSRLLDSKGYKAGIIAQPLTDTDYTACGRPKYFFCITSGLLDSMLANYTPMLKKRENVLVPERALMVYTQKIKQAYKESITIIGGVEATIRRFTHFDYKENNLRRGILNDTKADILLFGTAERAILKLIQIMSEHNLFNRTLLRSSPYLHEIEGAAFRIKKNEIKKDIIMLPSYEECTTDKKKFSLLTRINYFAPDSQVIEQCGSGFIFHNRREHTFTEEEMDYIYSMPFTRSIHPKSKNLELQEKMTDNLRTSVIIGRGCWGGCHFCVIPLVQGKETAKRSRKSILKEIEAIYAAGENKINDLTMPTLNMYGSRCDLYKHPKKMFSPIIEKDIVVYDKKDYCNQECAGCRHRVLNEDLYSLLEDIEKLQQNKGKELELRSAIRHDIILKQKKLFRKIMQFTQRLKIAPEHISDKILKNMNKATRKEFEEFLKEYKKINDEQKTRKNLVPYFIAAYPSCTEEDMKMLKEYCKKHNIYVNLTQIFTPTPGTVATTMYYTEENPITKEKLHVPRTFRERKNQKNILMDAKN
ncbi:YgiQ family radical SAM protein [Candidatus Woesearchaeota archaeon CG10_big_fil_rev_8_21_14_0_10_34_8]|nr:MAG: YgiQ family radical SAM protein [Candidatus Woesearchaeota archaeon CG10_big_fil_rev_8_21_14_0_10_34_8]